MSSSTTRSRVEISAPVSHCPSTCGSETPAAPVPSDRAAAITSNTISPSRSGAQGLRTASGRAREVIAIASALGLGIKRRMQSLRGLRRARPEAQ